MTGNLVAAAPSGAAATAMVASLVYALVGVLVYCWYAAALAALFSKMGAPKWKAWVPVVSQMEVLERVGRPTWHVVIVLFVPLYGLWVWALALHRINESFGRGAGYTALGVLVPPVWASLLGWGSDQPDFEPQRMYPTMAPSMGRGPLAAPESVPMWAGAPMGAPAALGPGQPWAPAGAPAAFAGAPAAPLAAAPGGFSGFGQPAATPDGLPPVLQTPMPTTFGQPALPDQPVGFGDPAAFGQAAAPGQAAAFGQPYQFGEPVAVFAQPGQPAVFGQPDQPAVFGQAPAVGEPAAFGQPMASGEPAAFGQPTAPGEPAASGQVPAPGQPWPQEQTPWPQSEPSTLADQFPAAQPAAPYAPQPVDLASFGQPDSAVPVPPDPAVMMQPDPFAASAPVAPDYGPALGAPVPDPRFAAAVPPVAAWPAAGQQAGAAPAPGDGLLVPPPPGAILPPVAPVAPVAPVQSLAPVAAADAAPAPQPPTSLPAASLPAASLPATSLPVVSAAPASAPVPVPLSLVGSPSDAQQTVVIPLPDDDIDGTVVVRRPTFQPWVLSLDDGRTFVIRSRSVVIGRRPESVDLGVQVLTITDDGRTISKTHARLDLVDDVWRVVDMGSTNGVVATDADGEEVDVEPGRATPVYGRLVLGAVGMRLTPGGSA